MLLTRQPARARLSVERLEARDVPAVAADWFTASLDNAGVRDIAQTRYLDDQKLDRKDVLAIFKQAEAGTVTANELHDLRALVANSVALGMTTEVANLADKTVNDNDANKMYQGAKLVESGHLNAGDDGGKLTNLYHKWFLGDDHPDDPRADEWLKAGGTLYGTGGPRIDDVKQGASGDCYFLAALGALARNDSERITDMIHNNQDGTYTVRFFKPDGSADYVTVDRWFSADNQKFVRADVDQLVASDKNVLWVPLIEKAYAQLAEEGWSRGAGAANSYRSINQGNGYAAMEQLTGLDARHYSFDPQSTTPQATKAQLILDVTSHKAVTIVTKDFSGMPNGLIPTHFYTITGYDPDTREFTLQNPYADIPNHGLRTVKLTWAQLVPYFNYYCVTDLGRVVAQ